MQVLAQPAAAIQIAEHALGQDAQRVVVLRPLQLLPAITQMFEHVAQPQQIRALLTHGSPSLMGIALGTRVGKATAMPLAAACS